MLGRDHLICGGVIGLAGATAVQTLAISSVSQPSSAVSLFIHKTADDLHMQIFGGHGNMILIGYTCINVVLFLIGCLLPDIDSSESLLGRYVHLPVKHRTITHAIWLPVIIYILSRNTTLFNEHTFVKCLITALASLSAGYIVHLILDSLSIAGIPWLYPLFSQRSSRHVYLYRTGEISETIIAVLICIVSLSLICWMSFALNVWSHAYVSF